MNDLSHLNNESRPQMVDVSEKALTARTATASCLVMLGEELMGRLEEGDLKTKKGGVFQTAVIAGIMGAKKTPELIPMCHPIGLEKVNIEILPHDDVTVKVSCTCKITSKTGVEMEALTGASTAALTVYDMCKSVNPGIMISELKLEEKRGGKSDFQA